MRTDNVTVRVPLRQIDIVMALQPEDAGHILQGAIAEAARDESLVEKHESAMSGVAKIIFQSVKENVDKWLKDREVASLKGLMGGHYSHAKYRKKEQKSE